MAGLEVRACLQKLLDEAVRNVDDVSLEGTMSEEKKCAHEACCCPAAPGSKYCSNFCEDSKHLTTLTCDCGHECCKTGARL